MLSNSLQTRGVLFAYLIGPPRYLTNDDALDVYKSVREALKLHDLRFEYAPGEPATRQTSRAFSLRMERREGRGGLTIALEYPGSEQPMRLLLEYHWPASDVHVDEHFDDAASAILEQGGWQRVMAEARLRTQCEADTGDALGYLRTRLLSPFVEGGGALEAPIRFASVQLHASPDEPTGDALAHPSRELTIEVLREDPRFLYIELMSQWTQFPVGVVTLDPSRVRPITLCPSDYLEPTREALRAWIRAASQ